MIGPSAPNGPPDPIEIADDSGFRIAKPRLHFASIDQNRFQRFRNPVPANPLGTVPRHKPDDESPAHGHQDREPAQMVSRRGSKRGTQLSEVEEIGEEADQPQQRPCDTGSEQTDRDRKK